uniref:hypothetical protein n=1 Tax=Tessaracoccus timonensis TaxID=2161816 RepID=UPI00131F3E3B|nr:hypothetical protein [Tessaracoccus timonensis]
MILQVVRVVFLEAFAETGELVVGAGVEAIGDLGELTQYSHAFRETADFGRIWQTRVNIGLGVQSAAVQ